MTTRRSFLAQTAATALASPLALNAAEAVETDPIFAAIERARHAEREHHEACDALAHAETTFGYFSAEADSVSAEIEGPAADRLSEALHAFIECEPTTLAGCIAKLKAANEPWSFGDIGAEQAYVEPFLDSIIGCLERAA